MRNADKCNQSAGCGLGCADFCIAVLRFCGFAALRLCGISERRGRRSVHRNANPFRDANPCIGTPRAPIPAISFFPQGAAFGCTDFIRNSHFSFFCTVRPSDAPLYLQSPFAERRGRRSIGAYPAGCGPARCGLWTHLFICNCGLSGRQSLHFIPARCGLWTHRFALSLRSAGDANPCNCAFPAGRNLWMRRFFIIIAERRGRRSLRGDCFT